MELMHPMALPWERETAINKINIIESWNGLYRKGP